VKEPSLPLSYREWTVIARSASPGHWQFTGGWSSEAARAASDANEIVAMHRRVDLGWQLVARLAGPAWRRFQTFGRAVR